MDQSIQHIIKNNIPTFVTLLWGVVSFYIFIFAENYLLGYHSDTSASPNALIINALEAGFLFCFFVVAGVMYIMARTMLVKQASISFLAYKYQYLLATALIVVGEFMILSVIASISDLLRFYHHIAVQIIVSFESVFLFCLFYGYLCEKKERTQRYERFKIGEIRTTKEKLIEPRVYVIAPMYALFVIILFAPEYAAYQGKKDAIHHKHQSSFESASC